MTKDKEIMPDYWGDPERSQHRTDTTRRERIAGIAWLSVGALFGVFVSVVYLGTTIGGFPFPWPVLFAPLYNRAISNMAKLWTDNIFYTAIPLAVWTCAVLLIAAWPGEDQLMPQNIWALLLMFLGFLGGAWPLRPNFSFAP